MSRELCTHGLVRPPDLCTTSQELLVCVNTCSHSCWSRVNTSLLQLLVQLCPLLTEAASRTHSPPRPSAMHKIITLVISYNSTAVQLRTVGSLSLSLTHSLNLSLSSYSLSGPSHRRAPGTRRRHLLLRHQQTLCQQCVNSVSTPLLGEVLVMCQHLFLSQVLTHGRRWSWRRRWSTSWSATS